METLDNKERELRQSRAELDSQKQQLSSVIEDLRAENEQLRNTQTENDTQLAELSATNEKLQAELQQLRNGSAGSNARNAYPAGRVDNFGPESEQLQDTNDHGDDTQEDVQQASEEAKTLRDKVLELKQANQALKTEVDQERADKASISTTLQGAIGIIQGAISLGTRDQMEAQLKAVSDMMKGVLNLGNRIAMRASRVNGAKRGRSEDEDGDDVIIIPDPKRGRA